MIDFDIYFKDSSSRTYDDLENFLFESGFDDASFGSLAGVYFLSFESEPDQLGQTLKSTWSRVLKAGLTPFGIGPDDLVNASEISRRWGVSREAVSKAIRRNDFPTPVHMVSGAPIWSWKNVAQSLYEGKKIDYNKYDIAIKLYDVVESKQFHHIV